MTGLARAPCTYDEVDTATFDASQRFAMWRETGSLPMTAEPVDADGRQHFRIRLRKLSGVSGRFTDLTATPLTLTRENRHHARDGLDMVSLTLMLGPHAQHQFGDSGKLTVVQPGQILIKDFTRPATARWHTSSRSLNLHLPRITVENAVGDKVKRLHGAVLSGEGLSPMLEAQLRVLAKIASSPKNTMRTAALDATAELAASVLRYELGVPIEDEANDAGIFVAAQMVIRRHLSSNDLNPELIARQLHCSRAHLYRVFAARGEAVAKYVRELRLQRAYELLTRNDTRRVQIGDIAYHCGFEEPAHFTRLFHQRFGLTPSELRSSGSPPIVGEGTVNLSQSEPCS
ncbi:MAG: helix-turn-helix domain-containing protein [Alphaproteobacteria bacterium]|nr:helix-turn-helix domain-containing protein [Alphaproteobacteria bacterium]